MVLVKNLIIASFLLLLASVANLAYGQCGSIVGQGNTITPQIGCAPLVSQWDVTFDLRDVPPGGNTIEIIVDWGDFSPTQTITATNTTTFPSGGSTIYRYAINASHTYNAGATCTFITQANLIVNGVTCTGNTQSQPVTVWSNDNESGAAVDIAPDPYTVCAGNEVTVNFSDITEYNCVPPAEIDNINDFQRFFAWEYGTATTITGTVLIDGNPQGFPYYDGLVADNPQPALGPNGFTSMDITVPATAQAGEFFEITLYYWNLCNPYNGDPLNPNFNDAVEATARIEVIPPPLNPSFTISTDANGTDLKTVFCPGEEIRFRGNTDNHTGSFQYSWEVYDGPTDADPLIGTRNNDRFTWLIADMGVNNFPNGAGTKLIRMYVENPGNATTVITGDCEVFVDRTIEIINTPEATIATDGNDAVEELEACITDPGPFEWTFTDVTNASSTPRNTTTETRWRVLDLTDGSDQFGPSAVVTGTTADNQAALAPFTFPDVGHYQVILDLVDSDTDCSDQDVVDVYIYDAPNPDFDVNEGCEGEDTEFISTAFIPTVINGDAIDTWEWDFDWDGVDANFSADETRTNGNPFFRNLGGPGDYTVGLRVTTDKSCASAIYSETVTVYPKPNVGLNVEYATDYESNLAGDPYSGDPICPGTLLDFLNVSDEASNDPAITSVDYELEIDSAGVINVFRPIGGEGTSAQPNIFFNNTGSNVTYRVRLVALANGGGIPEDNCEEKSAWIDVVVLPGSESGFNIFEDAANSVAYDPTNDYCSPFEFFFQINSATNSLLGANDSLVWTVQDGATVLNSTTNYFGDPDYDKFSFEFDNDYPNVSAKSFDVFLQVFVDGVCVNPSQETVRVLPQPIGTFVLTDTEILCDEVTFTFEADQKGLANYDWIPSETPTNEIFNIDRSIYQVTFDRPEAGDPDLSIDISLQTTNPFGCISDLENDNVTISAKEQFTLDFQETMVTDNCTPSEYTFQNNTTGFSAGTRWEIIITKFNGVDYLPYERILGDTVAGNTDFAIPYSFTFDEDGDYNVELVSTTPDNCIYNSSPPINIVMEATPRPNFDVIVNNSCAPLEPGDFRLVGTPTLSTGEDFNMEIEIVEQGSGTTVFTDTFFGDGTVINGYEPNVTLTNTVADVVNYEFRLTTFKGACSRDSVIVVPVFQESVVTFEPVEDNLCQEPNSNGDYEAEFALVSNNVATGSEYSYNFGDGSASTPFTTSTANVTHTYKNPSSFFGPFTYTVTLTVRTPEGCIKTFQEDINLQPRILANFFHNQIACSPATIDFNSTAQGPSTNFSQSYFSRLKGSGNSWQLFTNTPNTIGQVSETFTNNFGVDTTFEIMQVVTYDAGICPGCACSDSAFSELKVFSGFDTPEFTGPDTVCYAEQSVKYIIPPAQVNAGSNYIWTFPAGTFSIPQPGEPANRSEITVFFGAQSGPITVTEIDANGCQGTSFSKDITVLERPTGTISAAGPTVICPGSQTSLRFELTGAAPGATSFDVVYSNGFTRDTLENISPNHVEPVTPDRTSTYFILSVIDNDFPSCQLSQNFGQVDVVVNFPPSVTMTGNATTCSGQDAFLFFNIVGGVGPWEIIYRNEETGLTETVNTTIPFFQETVSPTVTTEYTVVSITDSNTPACTTPGADTVTITVNPPPTGEMFGDQGDLCAGQPAEIGIRLTGVPPWTIRYTDGTNVFTLLNIQPQDPLYDPATSTYIHVAEVFPQPGTTTYQLVEVRDSNSPSCADPAPTGSATLEAFGAPTVDIEGDTTICNGGEALLNFSFSEVGPFYDVEFAVSNYGQTDTVEVNGLLNGDVVSVDTLTSSTIFRAISVTDERGCSSISFDLPVRVNVNPLPTSTISANDTICFGEQAELVFDNTGIGPWTITYNDGSNDSTFTTNLNRFFLPVSPTVTTNYSIVSVEDSNLPQCSNTGNGTASVVVNSELVASFTATPQDMVLPEATVNITNTTTNKGEWDYSWDFGDGNTSTDVDPGSHTYETYGDYRIVMQATNGQCTDEFATTITIGAIPPVVDFTADPIEGCVPLIVNFENLTQFADPATYQWEFGDNQRASGVENPTHIYSQPGTYTVTLSANNVTGQRTEVVKEQFITVYETPQASYTIPDDFRQVFTGEEVQMVNTSVGADEFIWRFGDGNTSFQENPVHVYADSGIYDITLISINSSTGCQDSFSLEAQVQVILGGESAVANAFTPSRNGPGTGSTNAQSNDYFIPELKGVAEFNMKIYNRWGELLYETNDKTQGWDGYYQGELMPQDVYVYRLELTYENGRKETKVGDVTLIR